MHELATGADLLKATVEYAYAAGKLARGLEEFNREVEAFFAGMENDDESIRGLRLRSDAGSGSDIERHDPVNA